MRCIDPSWYVPHLPLAGASHPVLSRLPGVLRALPDVERHLGRMLHGNASPSELLTVLQTFKDLHLNLGMSADLDGPAGAQGSQPPLAPTGVRSILLGRLLAAAADLQCAAAARDTLACINEDAAAVDDKLRLFADDVRFADVAEKRADVVAAEATLSALRPVLAEMLNVKKVEYVHVQNQGDYLVEVPVELEKRAPKAWEKISSTKKVVRFRPPEVKAAMRTLELAKEHLALTAAAAWRRLQQEFSVHYSALKAAVQALASLDCLSSFASLAVAGSYCRPEFVADTEPPQLHIVAGRHPVLDVLLEGSFVANDIALCGDGERCAVITGPNMGGKSCFIRQAALLAIMAQAGSLVPAQSCRLHAFDAVFTRMGAADNIALGRSTFLEELSEASTILSRATPRSLVVIDELGRGTSTRDGMAVAQATLDHIVRNVRCLTLFVTHYPEVAHLDGPVKANAGSFYMAHLLEQDAQGRAGVPKVTFLYRVTRGVAAASYGINVARMAGLPPSVVHRAAAKAEAVEEALRAAETAEVAREVQRRLKAVVDGNLSAEELAALQALIREKLHVS